MIKNRITAILVSVFILLNICTVFATGENSSATDYQQYTEAAETMAALGFAQSYAGEDLINKRMTRSEFIDVVVKMLNQNTAWADTQIFTDVDKEHTYASSVNTAYSLGLISGFGGEFKPDDPVTLEQAAKILVLALGYRLQAESMGGYPEGYLTLAGRLDITKGISAPKNTFLRNGIALLMAFNCLEADLVEMKISTSEEWEVSVVEGATILSAYHNIKKGRGVVNKTPVSSLSSAARSSAGFVEIGEKLYKTGASSAEDYLGYRVTWYCDSEDTLLYTYCDMKYNEGTSVDIADIVPGSFNSDGEKFSYTDKDGKTQNIRVSHYADYLYNGVSTGSFKPELLTGDGYVTFIDNNSDKTADVVMIYSYEIMIADAIDKVNFKAFGQYTDLTVAELEETSMRTVRILLNGKKVSIGAIKEMDVLSVFKSLNTNGYEHIQVVIGREKVSGEISWIDDENNVGISDAEYKISDQITDKSKPVSIGLSGQFYLDAYGKIVHYEKGEATEYDTFNYGYIMAAGLEGGINKKLQIKLLTINNEIDIFDCDEKIIIDGFKPKSSEDALKQLTQTNGKCELVVRYKMNENRVITALDTVESGPKAGVAIQSGYGIKAEDEDSLRLDLPMTTTSEERRRWIRDASSFGLANPEVLLSGAVTKVLIIPPSGAKVDDDFYNFTTRSYFTSGSYYHIAGYNLSDQKLADLVVAVGSLPSGIPEKGYLGLVDKVVNTTNDKGESVQKIRMIYRGSMVERMTVGDTVANGVKQGDIILWSANHIGEIVEIKKMFDENTSLGVTSSGANVGYFYADMSVYCGVALNKDGNEMLLSLSADESDTTMQVPFSLSSVRFGIYSKADKTVSVANASEIEKHLYSRNPNARVLVACYVGSVQDVYIMDLS